METPNTSLERDPNFGTSPKPGDLVTTELSPNAEKQLENLIQKEVKTYIEDLQKEIKSEGQEVKKDFLTFFGLFASFVTFLSIEVQIFKNKDNVWELIGVTSISISFVMLFAIVINDIAKDKSNWSDFVKPIYLITIFFASIGTLCLFMGNRSTINKMDSFEKKIASDSIEIFGLKKECNRLRNNIDSIASKMDSLRILITSPPKVDSLGVPIIPHNNSR